MEKFNINTYISSFSIEDDVRDLICQKETIEKRIQALTKLQRVWAETSSYFPDVKRVERERDDYKKVFLNGVQRVAEQIVSDYFSDESNFVKLYEGRKTVETIKKIRAETCCGLKEAKDAFDCAMEKHHQRYQEITGSSF